MTVIDYAREPHSDIAFIDMKSFYASVECVDRGLNPLTTCLCVMSRADNANGLILASSPIFKKIFGKANVSRSYDLPFHIQTRKFNLAAAKRQGLPINQNFIRYVENWAQKTVIVPPRMDRYIEKNMEIQKIFQKFAAPTDILPYSIDVCVDGADAQVAASPLFCRNRECSHLCLYAISAHAAGSHTEPPFFH